MTTPPLAGGGRKSRIALYWRFVRPFTLLVPAAGMVSGALMALGAPPAWESDWSESWEGILARILGGALLAAFLNAFSNSINQIYDVEVDRVNKPQRLLPRGEIGVGEAWGVGLAALAAALVLAWGVNRQCLAIVALAALCVLIYSAPPLRTKGRGFWANVTIALPRGTLLVAAGWSTVKSVLQPEPWYLGAVFGLYFLGASSTKDFSDVEGDRLGGCRTLPVRYGIRRSAWIVAPFLVFPFLLLTAGALGGLLSGKRPLLAALGVILAVWGAGVARLLIRTPEERSWENHPSWKQMYLLTLAAQAGLALAYLLP